MCPYRSGQRGLWCCQRAWSPEHANRRALCAMTEWAVYTFASSLVAANLVMVWASVEPRFFPSATSRRWATVRRPCLYTVVSLWSSLEGSILFWGLHSWGIPGSIHLGAARSTAWLHRLRHGHHVGGGRLLSHF